MVFASIFSPTILSNHVQVFHAIHKEIPGYDGAYCVGSDGGVWTRLVKIGFNTWIIDNNSDWRLLSPSLGRYGYPSVTLYRNGNPKSLKTCKLVAEAFIGPCPLGLEICHEDGVRSNSHLCNLRYDTRKNNHADKIKHGTDQNGERGPNVFLTQEVIDKMRAEFATGGVTKIALAAKYHTSGFNVGRIIRYERWVRL